MRATAEILCSTDDQERSTAESVGAVHEKIDSVDKETGERLKKDNSMACQIPWLVEKVGAPCEKHPMCKMPAAVRSID